MHIQKLLLTAFAVTAFTGTAFAETSPVKYQYNYNLVTRQVPANWIEADTQYGSWENVGEAFDCSNWSPSTSTVGKGVSFAQTATDCKQNQSRWAQDYKKKSSDGTLEKNGSQYTENRVSTGSDERSAIGILENWMVFTPTYTSWVDTNALYGCSAWTPNPSVYTETANFTQTSATCKTDQERQRQEREQERYTFEVRNSGDPVSETQTLNDQTATRPYAVVLGAWTASGEPFDCSNWSPAVETIGKGVAFTQNATDCKLAQTRTRAESYRDHSSGATVPVAKSPEARTLTGQAGSKAAVGTMESWVAATPSYTAWVNTNALNACSNWSPAASTKTTTGSFTQTATNCTTDQTRNRQDREQESTTLVYRDKGTPAAETQTVTGQTATRSYSVTLGTWTNNGTATCATWTPDASTVALGTSFTQTSNNCSQPQVRSRTESYVDHQSGSTVAVSVPNESQTLTGQSGTQTATGTKPLNDCRLSTTAPLSYWTATTVPLPSGQTTTTTIYFDGVKIISATTISASATSTVIGGYTYTRATTGTGYKEVCRK